MDTSSSLGYSNLCMTQRSRGTRFLKTRFLKGKTTSGGYKLWVGVYFRRQDHKKVLAQLFGEYLIMSNA